MNKPLVFNYKSYTDLKAEHEALILKHTQLKAENTNLQIRCRIAEAMVKELETKMKVGEWLYNHEKDEHYCSLCKNKAPCDDYIGIDWQLEILSRYCPSCGAKMKGGAE